MDFHLSAIFFFNKWVAWDFYIAGAGINGNGELKDTHR